MSIVCTYCNREFAQTKNLKKHYERCREKPTKILIEQYEIEKKQIIHQLQQEIQTQQLQTQQQLHSLTEKIRFQQQQHEQQLQTQKDQYERELRMLKEQLEKFENQIFEIAKQPKQNTINNTQTTNTHNNQRILNIINQLIPMNLSEDDLRQLVTKYYTTDTFLGGPESIAQMTVNHILIDQETGKFRVVCTDTARGIFYFQDADNNLIRDIGMQKIQEKLIAPLNEATRLEYERLEKKKQMNPHRLMNLYGDNLSCIGSNELPNRMKKSIQLPIPNANANINIDTIANTTQEQ